MISAQDIEEQSIREVMIAVWEALVGGAIDVADPSRWKTMPEFVSSRVHVTGAWCGDVALHCSPAVAEHITQSMFARRAPNPVEMRDALGEVANVIAGNLKALLPGPSRLSIPMADVTGGMLDDVRGGDAEQSVWFECDGQPFVVELVVGRES